jgi:hypothetical protein
MAATASLSRFTRKKQALYVGLDRPDDPRLILENARKLADVRPPDPVLGYLYAHARATELPRAAWIRRAQVAASIEDLLQDFFSHRSPWRLREMFDPESAAKAAQAMVSPRGVLALTFHGGFAALLPHFFVQFLNGGLVVDIKARAKFESLGANDPGTALFGALRALGEGRSVYVAPDGRFGKPAGCIQVLGASCPVGDGAAFLAYETGCDTVWYAMRRNRAIFAPVVEPGPSRAQGETFAQFRTRLLGFYRDRIEEHFMGDPRSVALHKAWRHRFLKAMEDDAVNDTRTDEADRGRP